MNKRELEQAGKEYVGDWLCWNRKELEALPTVEEKKQYLHDVGHFSSCAMDLAAANGDFPQGWNVDKAADIIYTGMGKAVDKYLKSQRGGAK